MNTNSWREHASAITGGAMSRYASPLRYPGGKAGLTRFLADTIELNDLRGCMYYEPYAGGAGAALSLLKQEVVSELYLNDADKRIYAFWRAALNSTKRFVERIRSVPLTVEEWHRQHSVCAYPNVHSQFDIGFAAFFMNRCNRSGVLTGAGPIGGYKQSGKWRLDVRFNRETLSERILALGHLRKRIHVSCEDAIDFLKAALPKKDGFNGVFVYLDPPYVTNGQRLYLNAYGANDHAQLAEYVSRQSALPWIMSYDNSELIRTLYANQRIALMPISYSLQEKRSAKELIISPQHLVVPKVCHIHGRESLLQLEESVRTVI
jgi:DNA adenine methylase